MAAPLHPKEDARLAALERLRILDTEPERAFDDLARLAAHICGTPIALVSLVDRNRQWFKARVGIPAIETPRDVSFCAHAILQAGLFVVPDATLDRRFAENPLVAADPKIRFYAGAVLCSPEGLPLGTLCVVDTLPREITVEQREALTALAHLARDQLQLRAQVAEVRHLVEEVQVLSGLIPICAWCRKVRDDDGFWKAVEHYVELHSAAQFSHGVCPECLPELLKRLPKGAPGKGGAPS